MNGMVILCISSWKLNCRVWTSSRDISTKLPVGDFRTYIRWKYFKVLKILYISILGKLYLGNEFCIRNIPSIYLVCAEIDIISFFLMEIPNLSSSLLWVNTPPVIEIWRGREDNIRVESLLSKEGKTILLTRKFSFQHTFSVCFLVSPQKYWFSSFIRNVLSISLYV